MGYPKPQDKNRRPKFMTQEFEESLPICNTCKIQNSCALYKFTINAAKVSDKKSGTNRELIDTETNFGCNWHSEHTDSVNN